MALTLAVEDPVMEAEGELEPVSLADEVATGVADADGEPEPFPDCDGDALTLAVEDPVMEAEGELELVSLAEGVGVSVAEADTELEVLADADTDALLLAELEAELDADELGDSAVVTTGASTVMLNALGLKSVRRSKNPLLDIASTSPAGSCDTPSAAVVTLVAALPSDGGNDTTLLTCTLLLSTCRRRAGRGVGAVVVFQAVCRPAM